MKITGFTRLLCLSQSSTQQRVDGVCVFAGQHADVLRAADTWLGYISALVTERHELRDGNHGSGDFCQRCTPVIATQLSCNLKHFSTDLLSDQGSPWRLTPARMAWDCERRKASQNTTLSYEPVGKFTMKSSWIQLGCTCVLAVYTGSQETVTYPMAIRFQEAHKKGT